MNPELPMKIYFPYHSWYYGHGPYTIHFVVSVAETQADCIRSYMEESGFDISSPVRRKIKDSISALMRAYKHICFINTGKIILKKIGQRNELLKWQTFLYLVKSIMEQCLLYGR